MTHLQSSVAGPALKCIDGMMFDGSQYADALEALKSRFGRDDDVIHACLQKIFSHSTVKVHDAASLESFQGTVHSAATTLKTLGFSGDLQSAENLRRAVQKLPPDLKRDWGKQAVELEALHERPHLAHFDDWLSLQLRVVLKYSDDPEPVSSEPKNNKSRVKYGSSRSIHAVEVKSSDVCPCCSDHHDLPSCPVFKKKLIDDRATYIAENGRCFTCLRPGHRSRFCKSSKICTLMVVNPNTTNFCTAVSGYFHEEIHPRMHLSGPKIELSLSHESHLMTSRYCRLFQSESMVKLVDNEIHMLYSILVPRCRYALKNWSRSSVSLVKRRCCSLVM